MAPSRREVMKLGVVDLGVETAELPNGVAVDLAVVRHPGASAIVALDTGGRVTLLRQWRHAVGGWLWEIPAGCRREGESPRECAERELSEEAGLAARRWGHLGAPPDPPPRSARARRIRAGFRPRAGIPPEFPTASRRPRDATGAGASRARPCPGRRSRSRPDDEPRQGQPPRRWAARPFRRPGRPRRASSLRVLMAPCLSIAARAAAGKRATGANCPSRAKRPEFESPMAQIVIPIYFDYASTLCYVAWHIVGRLEGELGFAALWKGVPIAERTSRSRPGLPLEERELARIRNAITSGRMAPRVAANKAEAESFSALGYPSFVLGDFPLIGIQPIETMRMLLARFIERRAAEPQA